jgi:hypothetical protein
MGHYSILKVAAFVLIAAFVIGDGTASAQKSDPKSKVPVPDWLAWRVLHESIAVRNDQVPDLWREHMSQELGLNKKQLTALASEGLQYLADIRRIDDEVRVAVKIRYPDIAMPPIPVSQVPPTATRIDPAEPRKSIQQRAEEDGFAVEVEARKQAALTQHIHRLDEAMSPSKVKAINKYVRTTIAPKIHSTSSTPEHRTPNLSAPRSPGK